MKYVLNDGTVIDLTNIYEVSDIKDYGNNDVYVEKSKLSFTIRFNAGKSKKVTLEYQYSDWTEAYKELKILRNDLLENWEKSKIEPSQ
jgi:hypothetical protein